jgi:hypothetical protein
VLNGTRSTYDHGTSRHTWLGASPPARNPQMSEHQQYGAEEYDVLLPFGEGLRSSPPLLELSSNDGSRPLYIGSYINSDYRGEPHIAILDA